MKRAKAKGFTLVEMIVVMIILAILAALLVPSMARYIDRANKNKAIVEARQVVMAAQTYASEVYAKGFVKVVVEYNGSDHTIYLTKFAPTGNSAKFYNSTAKPGSQPRTIKTMQVLSEVEGTINQIDINDKGQVIYVKYTDLSGTVVEYKDGEYTAN